MMDREKVIKGLECCGYSRFMDKCQECPYDGKDCFKRLKADALALVQEPEETRLVRHYSRPNVYADLWLHCEKCGGRVDDRYKPKFCPGCGRKVKWDG
jgi:hypothetical protein